MNGAISFDLNFWTLFGLILNFVLALFVAISNRSKVASDELSAVRNKLHTDISAVMHQVTAQGERLASIEAEVENGITKDDLTAVYDRLNVVVDATGPMQGRLAEMSKSMDRIDGHLIQLLQRN